MYFDFIDGLYLSLIPVIIMIIAILLDWIFGDMRWLFNFIWHPIVIIGKLIGFFDKKLNRHDRSNNSRMLRGLIVVILITSLSGLSAVIITNLIIDLQFNWLIEAFIISILLAARSLYTHAHAVGIQLKNNGIVAGRKAVSHLVGRETKSLDKHAVLRAAIESMAENFADGVVAPIFWYLLFGLPGLFIYKSVNTLDSMIGYKNIQYKDFGMVAARLDDILNLIPARIAGSLFILASVFIPTANPYNSLKIMWKFAGRHASPNAGWPEAAMAGAFDFALGGPRKYTNSSNHDTISHTTWIGDGRARLVINDLKNAERLYLMVNLILLMILLIYSLIN